MVFVFGPKKQKENYGLTPDFFNKCSTIFLRTAMRFTHNLQFAEDVVQITMQNMITSSRDFDNMPEEEIIKYTKKAILNNAVKYMEQVDKRNELSLNRLEEFQEAALTDTVWQKIAQTETLAEIRNCLNKLPERQKQVLVLFYLEDWSTDKIAKDLRITPGTVRSLRMRGLENLRKNMRQEGFDE